jgi:hypothetical protein
MEGIKTALIILVIMVAAWETPLAPFLKSATMGSTALAATVSGDTNVSSDPDKEPAADSGPPFDLMDSDRDGAVSEVEWTLFHGAVFDRIDTDHDGYLSSDELKAIMPGGHGPDRNRSGMDSDGDGAISKQEWSDFYANLFTALDVNGDGLITKNELKP